MGVIFDILGSFIVRAAIIVVILHLMINLNEELYKTSERVYLNEVLTAPSEALSNDVRLAGYNASTTFIQAKTRQMEFYSDIDNNGSPDIVYYYLSTTDSTLYRTVNGGTALMLARAVTRFRVRYFNIYGAQMSTGDNITGVKSIYIELTIISRNTYSSIYAGNNSVSPQTVTWEDHIFPPNL